MIRMFKLDELLAVAVPPKEVDSEWLEDAMSGVDYLVRSANSDEITCLGN